MAAKAPRVVHLRPTTREGRPKLVLLDPEQDPLLVRRLQIHDLDAEPEGFYQFGAGVWEFDRARLAQVRLAFEGEQWKICAPCLRAHECADWTAELRESLEAHGYAWKPPAAPPRDASPFAAIGTRVDAMLGQFVNDFTRRVLEPTAEEREAARVLGVRLPCPRDEVLRAFARAAHAAHPDKPGNGGSDEAMKRVIAARETLLAAASA